ARDGVEVEPLVGARTDALAERRRQPPPLALGPRRRRQTERGVPPLAVAVQRLVGSRAQSVEEVERLVPLLEAVPPGVEEPDPVLDQASPPPRGRRTRRRRTRPARRRRGPS